MIDPSYETPSKTFFVMREGKGLYKVYRNEAVAASLCGTYHFKNDQAKAMSRAVEHANRLEEVKFGSAS